MGTTKGGGHGGQHHQQGAAGGKNGRQGMHEFERARMALGEVDAGVIEAGRSMGASTWQLITRVLIREAAPSLISNATTAATTILGYSAMAGFIGGGGLCTVAVNYGYNRYNFPIMLVAVIIIVIVVQIFQEVGMRLAHHLDKRNR